MDEQRANLEAKLEVDPRADTVVGVLTGADGVMRRFCGWMEFADAVEAWRTERNDGGHHR